MEDGSEAEAFDTTPFLSWQATCYGAKEPSGIENPICSTDDGRSLGVIGRRWVLG